MRSVAESDTEKKCCADEMSSICDRDTDTIYSRITVCHRDTDNSNTKKFRTNLEERLLPQYLCKYEKLRHLDKFGKLSSI